MEFEVPLACSQPGDAKRCGDEFKCIKLMIGAGADYSVVLGDCDCLSTYSNSKLAEFRMYEKIIECTYYRFISS
jgi:hypothetical protein